MSAEGLASGKGHRDENFPVASVLIAKKHRAPIMAFYRFARAADDVADNAEAAPAAKLAILEDMRQSLIGAADTSPEAVALREVLRDRGLTNQHGLDLLEAFRRDVTKLRYADWRELIDYCRYSAMPVGRFVLDVHGESRELWPLNDALCAALQVINHLQDCAKDYRVLNRVYLPMDLMERESLPFSVLDRPKSSEGLLRVLRECGRRTGTLLAMSQPFAGLIQDRRLSLEVSVIQTLAEDLCGRLMLRDPLCDRVHHGRWDMPGLLLRATIQFAGSRFRHRRARDLPAPVS